LRRAALTRSTKLPPIDLGAQCDSTEDEFLPAKIGRGPLDSFIVPPLRHLSAERRSAQFRQRQISAQSYGDVPKVIR